MSESLQLSLPEELRAFIDANSGAGTLYATPSELICDLLRQRQLQQESTTVRTAIREGYDDAIAGRVWAFEGNLRALLAASDEAGPDLRNDGP